MLKNHNITIITALPDAVKLPNVHYIYLDAYFTEFEGSPSENFTTLGRINPWKRLLVYADRVITGCHGMVKSYGFHQLMIYPEDFKFDLILYDYLYQPCLLPFYSRFKYPPLIAITANGLFTVKRYYGLFTPFERHPFYNGFEPTFWGRIHNFLLYNYDYLLKVLYIHPRIEKIVGPFIKDGKSLSEMENMANLVMINSHQTIETAEPILPNVIQVGGLHIRESRQMSRVSV